MKMRESKVLTNAITWNVIIVGYIQSGDWDQAMDLFQRMEVLSMTLYHEMLLLLATCSMDRKIYVWVVMPKSLD